MKSWKSWGKVGFAVLALGLVFLWAQGNGRAEEVQFRLGWKFGPENTPYYVALNEGYFSREGLDVRILEGSGSTDNVRLIGAREILLGEVDAGALITGLSRDIPLISFMAVHQKSPMGLVSLAETRMDRPSDLVGKSIGRNPKSVTAIGLDVFFKIHKISPKDLRLVPVGFTQEPMLLKKVDVQTTYVNTDVAVLRYKGYKVNLLLFADWGLHAYGTTLSTHRSIAKTRPELIRRFAKAAKDGWAFTLKDRERAADVFRKYHPRVDRKFALNVLELTEPLVGSRDTEAHGFGWQTVDMWNKTQEVYHSGGVLKKRIDVTIAFSNEMLK